MGFFEKILRQHFLMEYFNSAKCWGKLQAWREINLMHQFWFYNIIRKFNNLINRGKIWKLSKNPFFKNPFQRADNLQIKLWKLFEKILSFILFKMNLYCQNIIKNIINQLKRSICNFWALKFCRKLFVVLKLFLLLLHSKKYHYFPMCSALNAYKVRHFIMNEEKKHAIHHFRIINISFFLFLYSYLQEDHLLMIIVGFQKVIYIHFSIHISFHIQTLLRYRICAHIEQQASRRYMTRRVHYVQFTHRSWFPLTRNKNYIKSYSWGERVSSCIFKESSAHIYEKLLLMMRKQ